jgi:multidrug efflux pump subunit AcrA (membrane-fusion protein)
MALPLNLAGCKSESAPHVAAPWPVRAASVTLSASTDTRSYTGTIKPRYESDLGFRVSGKIVERLANVGDLVTPGKTLARLDAHDYQLSLESAEAELTAAQSSLKQADAAEKRYAELNEKKWAVTPATSRGRQRPMKLVGALSAQRAPLHWRRTSSPTRISWPLKPASSRHFRLRWGRSSAPAN